MTDAVETVDVRVIGVLVAAAVLLAGVFTVLSAYGGNLKSGSDGGAHALSTAGTGFSGIAAMAPAAGIKTRISRDERPGAAGLLVLTPPPGTSPAELAALIARREGDPVLVVLPKWQTTPLRGHRGWVQTTGALPPSFAIQPLRDAAPEAGAALAVPQAQRLTGTGDAEGIVFDAPPEQHVVSGKALMPVIIGGGGQMTAGWLAKRNLYILADPDLINNHGIRTEARARAAVLLLTKLGADQPGGLVFDVTLNGFARGQSLLRTALEPPFLAMTLALLAAAALALWHGAVRFGTPRPAPRAIAFGKRALVDNAAELIRMARREPAFAERYALLVRDNAAAAAGAPPALEGPALVEWLDRRGTGTRFADLSYEAGLTSNRPSALAAAQALYQWQQDATHDRR